MARKAGSTARGGRRQPRWRKSSVRFCTQDRAHAKAIADGVDVQITGGLNGLLRRLLAAYARLLARQEEGWRFYAESPEGERVWVDFRTL